MSMLPLKRFHTPAGAFGNRVVRSDAADAMAVDRALVSNCEASMEIVMTRHGNGVGVHSFGDISEVERQVRSDLAAAYRLIAYFGWDDLIGTRLSARIPGTKEFLIRH